MLLFCVPALILILFLYKPLTTKWKTAGYIPNPDKNRTELYTKKLKAMVEVPTVSWEGEQDNERFDRLHEVMEGLFPTVFNNCEVHILKENLLLKWKGKTEKNPILLLSHQDVVPAGQGWTKEPFAPVLENHRLYGRGTADTKASLMAFFQAADELMEAGFVPETDVYLAASCTEETGGPGIREITGWLKKHNIRLSMVVDEGGAIVREPIQNIPGLYAMVGLYEKGMGNVRFTAKSDGGHASAPSVNSPLVKLGKFMADVDSHSPMWVKLSPEVIQMFDRLGPYARGSLRFILLNARLLRPVLERALPKISSQAAAMTRTTIAFTMAGGSDAKNVLPARAWVLANLRFIPHQKAKESLAVLEKKAAKYGLEMEVLDAHDPSSILDTKGTAFQKIEKTIHTTFPGLEAIPYVVTGGTDCMAFEDVADACVRFVPVIFGPEQMKSMHGIDECIDVRCLAGAVDWYKNLLTE